DVAGRGGVVYGQRTAHGGNVDGVDAGRHAVEPEHAAHGQAVRVDIGQAIREIGRQSTYIVCGVRQAGRSGACQVKPCCAHGAAGTLGDGTVGVDVNAPAAGRQRAVDRQREADALETGLKEHVAVLTVQAAERQVAIGVEVKGRALGHQRVGAV